MRKTLFDILSEHHQNLTEKESLVKNISLLLNSRKGSVKHLPTYGLCDIESYFQNKQIGQLELAKELVETISLFENRITILDIQLDSTKENFNMFSYIIHAQDVVLGTRVNLKINVFSNSRVIVKEYKE